VLTAGQLVDAGQEATADALEAAYRALRRRAIAEDSFRGWTGALAELRKLRQQGPPRAIRSVKVGLIGTSTLDQLGEMLELAGLTADLNLSVDVGPYGQYESQALDPTSALYAAQPDSIVLAPDASAVAIPAMTTEPGTIVDRELERLQNVWAAVREHTAARLLQLTFVPPLSRPLGNLEAVVPGARQSMYDVLNRRLACAAAESDVHVVATHALAARYGLERWFDERYWFHGKQAVSLGALPALAQEIAAVLRASLGLSRKVLVTDLDDTLWGGVVGDDGVENLQLEGTPRGEAHLALQRYLLELKSRGILLVACSKNDAEAAQAPFEVRSDMLLKYDDFAAFVANWRPKSENLRQLADRLGLGLDSFVFLDDNPAERDLILQEVPEVDVIDLPPDPSGYLRALCSYRGFEPGGVTLEDADRTSQYQARAAANELRGEASNLDDYLRSLSMSADIEPFTDINLPRVAQLVGKTNQWNLTTRRHSMEALRRFATDPRSVTRTLRLHDRFGDHGIVAVAIATPDSSGGALDVDTFLMSCRVIGRTVEQTLLHELVLAARALGYESLTGRYVTTTRNGLVADVYGRLGFSKVTQNDQGSRWTLGLTRLPQTTLNDFIRRRG
jgi:FkbH-like protein